MTQIPFDPEFDIPTTHAPAPVAPFQSQPTGGFSSRLAFIMGLIVAFVAGSLLANAILIKLLIK